MLGDLAMRSRHLAEHYSDAGLTARSLFRESAAAQWTPYFYSGSAAWAGAVMGLHALAALLLLVGYRVRAATAVCLVLQLSLVMRNPVVFETGDVLMVWLLLWSLFLPTGARASIDALRWRAAAAKKPEAGGAPAGLPTHQTVRSVASAALLLQVAVVYWTAVTARVNADWWGDLSAVHYALFGNFGKPLGHVVGRFPIVTAVLTAATMAFEFTGPIVALLANRMPRVRTAVAVAFIFFHLSLAATMYVGEFVLVCCAAWLPFIPSEAWDALGRISAVRRFVSATRRWATAVAERLPVWKGAAAPADPARPLPPLVMYGATALFAYVVLVNLVGLAPAAISSRLNRLPRLKQNWAVMTEFVHEDRRTVLEGTLADGSSCVIRTLPEADPPPTSLRVLLWPPDDHGNRRFCDWLWVSLMRGYGGAELPATVCDYYARQWNAAHPPQRRVVEIRCVCESSPAAPPHIGKSVDELLGVAPTAPVVTRYLRHTWRADGTAPAPPPPADATASAATETPAQTTRH